MAPFGAPFFMPPLAAKTGQPGFALGKQANLASLEEVHPPFGGWRHHFPPAERWDYGYLAMESCLCRKA